VHRIGLRTLMHTEMRICLYVNLSLKTDMNETSSRHLSVFHQLVARQISRNTYRRTEGKKEFSRGSGSGILHFAHTIWRLNG